MKATEFAANSINTTLDFLNTALGDITDEQYNWQPPGTCNSIAKVHVHAVSAVDFFVNAMLGGDAPLWAEYSARLQIPTMPSDLWPSKVPISKAAIDEYVAQMREGVNRRLAALTDDVVAREIDTPVAGKQTGGWVLQLATMHTAGHAGEISAIKGVQGLRGLPF